MPSFEPRGTYRPLGSMICRYFFYLCPVCFGGSGPILCLANMGPFLDGTFI